MPDATSAAPTRLQPLLGHRVLVVEDDYLLAADLADAAHGAGAEVLGPCATEQVALDLLEELHPSAALVDINLGGIPSWRLARALRGWGVPFLFVTG